MKRPVFLLFVIVTCSTILIGQRTAFPKFSGYRVAVSTAKIKSPKWITFSKDDGWRDKLGKLVDRPEINFAGQYFLVAHSCGTDCRYYSLTNILTGKELKTLDQFAAAEPAPKMPDGKEYVPILYSRPNSRLLIVQYLIGFEQAACRERSFLFENQKLRPITKMNHSCRKL